MLCRGRLTIPDPLVVIRLWMRPLIPHLCLSYRNRRLCKPDLAIHAYMVCTVKCGFTPNYQPSHTHGRRLAMSKNPFGAKGEAQNRVIDLSPELQAKLDALEREHELVILADQFESMYKLAAYHEKRREKLKAIPNFWSTVLLNDTMFLTLYGNLAEDLEAIKYLQDVWVAREKPDPRAYTIEMVSLPTL